MQETQKTKQNNEPKKRMQSRSKIRKGQKRIKGKIFSFRITDEDAKEYDKICGLQSLTRSELLQQIITQNTKGEAVKIIPKKTKIIECKKDHEKLLYYFNKTSNNINQLAKKINTAFAKKIINADLMTCGINHLKNIESVLYDLAKIPAEETKNKKEQKQK